ncbi:hypothetical protein J120_02115 [candidate division TM6 bacterium JCVI TM6SC1]|uniref:Uncharacterized protein n=1 Tax=candidate division TM6 bacterium JCVI TM6SC1 TaxID=1306947 RepID=A0A0D2K653_9BACT|nr:hypothetical protein J120_02115 [candidate division TM6 bacterium JCVI TM6SC1]
MILKNKIDKGLTVFEQSNEALENNCHKVYRNMIPHFFSSIIALVGSIEILKNILRLDMSCAYIFLTELFKLLFWGFLAFLVLRYNLKVFSKINRPILTLCPKYLIYEDVIHTRKFVWKYIYSVYFKTITGVKRSTDIFVINNKYDNIEIKLMDLEASPFHLAPIFSQYKEVNIDNTFRTHYKLTYFYNQLFQWRLVIYLFPLFIIISIFIKTYLDTMIYNKIIGKLSISSKYL